MEDDAGQPPRENEGMAQLSHSVEKRSREHPNPLQAGQSRQAVDLECLIE
jgi:hypothetical protein